MTAKEIKRTLQSEFVRTLRKPFVDAVKAYGLVKPSDKVAVCISGGKDSMLMAKLMQLLQRFSDYPFEVVFLVMDPGYNEINRHKIESNAALLEIPVTIFETNIFEVANNSEKSPCYLCARMRRGILHNMAKEAGCNKLALGHHYDDAVETFFMNLFNSGSLDCFSPKSYLSRKELWLIRPLVFCGERQVAAAASRCQLPVVKSSCPADGSTSRQRTKELIARLEKDYPDLKSKVMGAVERAGIAHWDAV